MKASCGSYIKWASPAKARQALFEQLQRLSTLTKLEAPDQVISIIQDMMRATWFRIDTHDVLTLTSCGSRPGDPAADVLFALAFGEFLKVVDSDLSALGLQPQWPTNASEHPWAHVESDETLGAPAWADDFFVPQTGDCPRDLIVRTKQTIEHVVTRATSMGMRLTFARTKTAAMLPTTVDWTSHSEHVFREKDDLFLRVWDSCAEEWHHMPLVHSYKHLGGIMTSTATPRPDLLLRQNQALSVIKPLRKQLFRNKDIPLVTRRLLLRALSVSKLVHSASSLILPVSVHQRVWERAYIQVWRALLPRTAPDKQPHSLEVLKAAQAPSPPLALAKTRAAFLRQLTLNGPAVLRKLLFDHWCIHPRSSWPQQLVADYKLVSAYTPTVDNLLPAADHKGIVCSLLTVYLEDPHWWFRKVCGALRAFQDDVQRATQAPLVPLSGRREEAPPRPGDEAQTDRPFACHLCPASFVLRKHLCVHWARRHGIWSPSRHFAFGDFCLACNRFYGDVRRVQFHLKSRDSCLRRMCYLVPPLTTEQIRTAELTAVQRERLLRGGKWETFRGTGPSLFVFGPKLPTADERLQGLDFLDEEVTLDVFKPLYRPAASVVQWIEGHLAARTSEGPRQTAASYWHRGPFCKLFHSNL